MGKFKTVRRQNKDCANNYIVFYCIGLIFQFNLINISIFQSLETTKLLMRSHQRTKLELTNESECNLLLERWPSSEAQKAIENYLANEKNFIS